MGDESNAITQCRSDYWRLLEELKQLISNFNDFENESKALLTTAKLTNDKLRDEVVYLKGIIKTQQKSRRSFDNDVQQLEFAVNLIEIRENETKIELEDVTLLSLQMKKTNSMQSNVIKSLAAEVDRLHLHITKDLISRKELQCCQAKKTSRLSLTIIDAKLTQCHADNLTFLASTNQNTLEQKANIKAQHKDEIAVLCSHYESMLHTQVSTHQRTVEELNQSHNEVIRTLSKLMNFCLIYFSEYSGIRVDFLFAI